MASSIKLNFINRSNDVNNSEVLIYCKNIAEPESQTAIAWTVIKNCGQYDNHPFDFPMQSQVAASDSYGNNTPRFSAIPGQAFAMVLNASGDQLVPDGDSANPQEFEVRNKLSEGAINANVYKGGKLCAAKTNISPQQKAEFAFRPTIYIGVVSQVEEGEVINSAIISQINTEISLLGIASADIVMTGGGSGESATPFKFSLQNVQMA